MTIEQTPDQSFENQEVATQRKQLIDGLLLDVLRDRPHAVDGAIVMGPNTASWAARLFAAEDVLTSREALRRYDMQPDDDKEPMLHTVLEQGVEEAEAHFLGLHQLSPEEQATD